LVGLVYGATEIPSERHVTVYRRPIFWAAVVAAMFIAVNFLFW
jgi:SSS family solute:Na+ symporter